MKKGEGQEKGNPFPTLLLVPFFARSLTLVPSSLLLNRTVKLATQANCNLTCFPSLFEHT